MPDNYLQNKTDIREQARLHRNKRPMDETEAERLVDRFFEKFPHLEGKSVALYWPKGRELDTRFLIDELSNRDIAVLLPCIQPDKKIMRFAQWQRESGMELNKLGIPEPKTRDFADPDIILAPLLAFDPKGVRLGQGGGNYDATLTDLKARKQIAFGGLAYDDQAVLFSLPEEPHDQRLDFVITPDRILEFGR